MGLRLLVVSSLFSFLVAGAIDCVSVRKSVLPPFRAPLSFLLLKTNQFTSPVGVNDNAPMEKDNEHSCCNKIILACASLSRSDPQFVVEFDGPRLSVRAHECASFVTCR